MASYNATPVIGGALWTGNQALATRKQLLSSIEGLYADFQDINLSSITATNLNVSTLTAENYISTPVLYVSSIIGGGIQMNDGSLTISTGDFSFVSLSTLQLKGFDIGGINLSFNLGLGEALGGLFAGLGAAVGGAFVGIGTGIGLTLQGLTTGLATLVNGRGDNVLNTNVFETINGSTQIQISTLGDAYPLYSSITRSVSSLSANEIPGPEIFLSTFFLPGTTCIRSVSDPLSIISGDSNINTSTIQSFGQWVPFIDPTVAGEDIIARDATFSTIQTFPPSGGIGLNIATSNSAANDSAIYKSITMFPYQLDCNVVYSNNALANSFVQYANDTALMYGNQTIGFISTPYTQYPSTIGNYVGGVYFVTASTTSTLQGPTNAIPKLLYNGTLLGGGNFAVCEPDETGFLSTGTFDLVAQSSNITFQWGLAVDNFNSTIATGTSKRVAWNIPANTSNFTDIPQPPSTIVSNTLTTYQMKLKPLEISYLTIASPDNGSGGNKAGMAFDINRATFGATTTFNNQANYPYQFNNNLFVNGTLEADTIIAISSIVNVSTNLQTFFSTQTFDADEATISSLVVTSLANFQLSTIGLAANISTIKSGEIYTGDLTAFSFDTYVARINTSFTETIVADFQIQEGSPGSVLTNLNNIQGNSNINSKIQMTLGTFSNLSTNNLSCGTLFANNPTFSTINLSTFQEIGLTTIVNYPGAVTSLNTASGTTAPVVGIGFKSQIYPNCNAQTRVDYNYNQITGTSNGANFYPFATFDPTQTSSVPNLWSVSNVNTFTTSTLNVNTMSTTTHSGNNITANFVTINSNLNFPSVNCNATPLTMTLNSVNVSNSYVAFQANIQQGPAFPQQSNSFTITTSGSNTTIEDKEGLVFSVTEGTDALFLGVQTLTMNSGDVRAQGVTYGTTATGFLLPRAFRQSVTGSFSASQSFNNNYEVYDGTNTFVYDNYNLMTCLASFYIDNSALAWGEVVLAPFSSNGNWWVNVTGRVNAASSEDWTISWNNLLFPYNMMV